MPSEDKPNKQHIMRKVGLDESQVGIKIAGRNINNLRYADDTTLMAESEEELKSLLMRNDQHTLLIILKNLYTVGYSFSLASLVLALFIMLLFRKLHCTRNYIHMNLFASFILRAIGVLIKDSITHNTYLFVYTDSEKPNDENGWISILSPQKLAFCKVGPFFLHYTVGANYFWLLVEGIYLHRLLATVVSEKHQLLRYIFIGWDNGEGEREEQQTPQPACSLDLCLPETQAKKEDADESRQLVTLMVNFYIFLNIMKLLLSKLKAQQMSFQDYKFRLARSTLVLIPLLGIHEIVFSFITDEQIEGLSRHIKTFIHLTFSSFHVKAELRKQWSRFLLAYPFVCMPCLLGKNIKHLGRCPRKQHLSNNCLSLEVSQPRSMQVTKQRTGCMVELSPTLRHDPRRSISDSSEGEFTAGETIEDFFEESEI
ncbi:Glucagon-like peptide 2 receptor [Varanus komodoensis]|nr:Glucagon-like peptide 2 receptor [Varanus komodoensis]